MPANTTTGVARSTLPRDGCRIRPDWFDAFTKSRHEVRATREDGEAIDRIEKLIGHKIARAKDGAAEEPEAEKPKKAERRAKPDKAPAKARASQSDGGEEKRDRSPVVEDLKSDWNGPLPSFLSQSAG